MSLLLPLHLPLPWPGDGLDLPPVYMLGTWMAITLGMTFLMFYAWRVAAEARRMSDALAETQLALAREQELSSLGGLAAVAQGEEKIPSPEFEQAYLDDTANIEAGKEIWQEQCRHCHGKSAYPGKAPKLKPRRYKPDFVYDRITNGFAKTNA